MISRQNYPMVAVSTSLADHLFTQPFSRAERTWEQQPRSF